MDFLTQEGITQYFRNEMMTHVKSQIAKYIKDSKIKPELDNSIWKLAYPIHYEEEININIDENKILGLDYSMKELFVTDEMIKVNDKYLRLYRKYEERLHFLQKALCRRQRPNYKKGIKSSKRYEKLRKQIAALFEHMKNIRLDYYNKLSKEITNLYDIVVVEDINMQDMAVLSKYNSKATMIMALEYLEDY